MLLRIQDRILVTLALLGDLFEDLVDPGGIFSASYENIYGFTPRRYKKSNFVSAANYALRTGKIEKVIKNGEAYLRLTGEGKSKLVREFPLVWFQKRRWDGLWRVLPYDIKEIKRNQRNKLRRKLYELGFKQFQKSVYLSPHPIEREMTEFLKILRLEGKARVLLCKEFVGVKNKELVRKLWQLDKLNREYQNLEEKIGGVLSKKELREIKAEYLDLLIADPFLPQELLPHPWWGEKVRQKVKKVFKPKLR